MTRVLFLTQRFPPDVGGLAVSAHRTAHSLVAAGVEVEVVAWTRSLPPGQLETVAPSSTEPNGPIVHRIGLYHNQDLTLQHTTTILEWLHREHGFDLVWGHYLFPPGFLAVLFAERVGLPSVVSARGNDVDRMVFPPGDFARLKWTLQRATRVVAVSKDLATKIDVILGRPGAASVMPNVVDTEMFCPGDAEPDLRRALGILDAEAVLGFAGELRHKKGLPFLLAGLAEVRRKRPACLLVIGEVRAREQEHLARFALEHGDDRGRILVTGHLENTPDVVRHLRLCDVFLMPSLWDGMPNAVLEAMAVGLPVIASDAGGIPEIVDDQATGLLIDRVHLDRLGEGVLELLERPAEAQRLGAAARAAVSKCFQPAGEVSALREILAGIASSSER
jgi:glycosyltransferase involved in cell wall biosynthesis